MKNNVFIYILKKIFCPFQSTWDKVWTCMEGGEGISLVSLMVGLALLLKRVKKLEANDAENKKKIDLLERKLDQLNQSRIDQLAN